MKRLLICLLALSCAPVGEPPEEATLVIENARVIVGDGRVLDRATIVVAGDRIVSVGPAPVESSAAIRIDMAGKTVLPGLIDTHVHLTVEHLFEQPRSDGDIRGFIEERLPERLEAFLEAGITTVMSPGEYWPFVKPVRDAQRSGAVSGPRIYTAGALLTAPDGHPAATFCGSLDVGGPNPWCREHLTREVDTAAEARESVARLAEEGADHIKFVYDETDGEEVTPLDGELVDDILEESHAHGLRAYAHILDMPRAIHAIELGLDGLVHPPAVAVEEDDLERLVSLMGAEGVVTSTTLTTFASAAEILGAQGNEQMAMAFTGLVEGMQKTLAALDGGLVALGTDSPHLPAADAYHREIELVSEAGLSPEQIVDAATRAAAAFMGLGADLGTLESGKLADLIVVEGDPLSDLAALRDVVLVVQGGEVVSGSF